MKNRTISSCFKNYCANGKARTAQHSRYELCINDGKSGVFSPENITKNTLFNHELEWTWNVRFSCLMKKCFHMFSWFFQIYIFSPFFTFFLFFSIFSIFVIFPFFFQLLHHFQSFLRSVFEAKVFHIVFVLPSPEVSLSLRNDLLLLTILVFSNLVLVLSLLRTLLPPLLFTK